MTDLERVRELIAKIPTCAIVSDHDTYIEVTHSHYGENISFEFDKSGNIIDLYI